MEEFDENTRELQEKENIVNDFLNSKNFADSSAEKPFMNEKYVS